MRQYRCSECGTYWTDMSVKECPNCGSIYKGTVDPIQAAQDIQRKYGEQWVQVNRLALSWGDAFSIGFKFCVVLAVFQAAFLFAAYLLWG